MKVAAIVPAHDEEKTIGAVIRALKAAPSISEVIVVSDGSSDRTVEAAHEAGADVVLPLGKNVGKGGALANGVAATDAEILFFCDADFIGFGPEAAERLIRPVVEGKLVMCAGLRDRGPFMNAIEAHLPLIGGERAVLREVFKGIPARFRRGFRVELALNYYCRVNRLPYGGIPSFGVTQVRKMTKVGIVRGLWAYVKMTWELAHAMTTFRFHRNHFLKPHESKERIATTV